MIKLFSLLILASCANTRTLKDIAGSENIIKRTTPVASREEARKEIIKQRNFLKLLFEQTRDPYYGTPRWSEECLKQNQIGEIIEEKGSIRLISHLLMDQRLTPGVCPESGLSKPMVRIFLYCEGSPHITEYLMDDRPGLDTQKVKWCPEF